MSLKTVVVEGAKFLDEHVPNWYEKVDTERLNMHSLNMCIVGQLYFDNHNFSLATSLEEDGYNHYDPALGFDLPQEFGGTDYDNPDSEPWQELRNFWIEQINERKNNV